MRRKVYVRNLLTTPSKRLREITKGDMKELAILLAAIHTGPCLYARAVYVHAMRMG